MKGKVSSIKECDDLIVILDEEILGTLRGLDEQLRKMEK